MPDARGDVQQKREQGPMRNDILVLSADRDEANNKGGRTSRSARLL